MKISSFSRDPAHLMALPSTSSQSSTAVQQLSTIINELKNLLSSHLVPAIRIIPLDGKISG